MSKSAISSVKGTARDRAVSVLQVMPRFRGRLALACYLGRLLTDPDNSTTVARLNNGYRLLIDLLEKDHEQIYYFGTYESQTIETLRRYLASPGAVFCDIGASVGIWSVLYSNTLKQAGGKAYAFEPTPANYEFLVANIQLNRLQDTIVPIQKAVGAEPGQLELRYATKARVGNAIAREADFGTAGRGCTYPVRADRVMLDRELENRGVCRIDLVKIDIEGYDYFALQGFRDMARKCRPAIFCEFNVPCMKHLGIGEADVRAWARELDYREHVIQDGSVIPIAEYPSTRRWDLCLLPVEGHRIQNK